jgi:hypothetical protein
VTKARKQERDEERRTILTGPEQRPAPDVLKKTPAARSSAKSSPSEKRSLADSPDLLASLTGRKTSAS